jgi:non-heme chloroperoxidase
VVQEIHVPVLITHGIEDQLVLLNHARYNAQLVLNGRTSFYENVGHIPFWENAEKFNNELRQFIYSL